MRLRAILWFGFSVLACAWFSSAHAQDGRERARVLFQEGVAHYDAGDFSEALQAFEAAYRAAPHPAVRINIANCLEQLGRYSEAVSTYKSYLATDPAGVSAAQRSEIQATIDRLSERFGTLDIELSPSEATVTVDGEELPRAANGQVSVAPGEHVVRATLPGYEPEQTVVHVAGGRTQTLTLLLHERPASLPVAAAAERERVSSNRDEGLPTAHRSARRRSLRPWLWVNAGLTLAFSAGFATTAGLTYREQKRFDDHAASSRDLTLEAPVRAQAVADGFDARERTDRLALASDVLLGGAILAASTTLVLWWIERRQHDPRHAHASETPHNLAWRIQGSRYGVQF